MEDLFARLRASTLGGSQGSTATGEAGAVAGEAGAAAGGEGTTVRAESSLKPGDPSSEERPDAMRRDALIEAHPLGQSEVSDDEPTLVLRALPNWSARRSCSVP